ncbi:MAG: hypothetical protein IPP47_30565 [Bryobacterales bacterium]|nr:hypothetical protein [Bryobacterales bacterium]
MAESTPATLAQLLKEQDAIQQKIEASVQSELDAIQARLDALASIGKYYRLVEGVAPSARVASTRGRKPRSTPEEKSWIDQQIVAGKKNKEIIAGYLTQFGKELQGYAVANRRTKLKK